MPVTTTPAVANNAAFGGPNATQAAAANTALGVTAPPVTTAAPVTSTTTIDASKIGTAPSITLPPAPTDGATGLTQTLTSIPTIASITAQENTLTPAEQTNKTMQDKLLSLSDQEAGKTMAQTAANNNQGIPALNAQLTDLNSQIVALKNEATAIPIQDQQDAQGRGMTAAGLAPIETGLLRNNTIKALGLSSLASALQGNIATAQAQADAAVKAQFDPIEAQISYVQNAIAANKDQMTKEEKTQADIVSAQLAERQTQITYQREDMSTAHAWAAAAVTNNPGNPAAQLAAQQSLNIDFTQPGALQKAMSLLAPYRSNPQTFAKNAADIALTRAQTSSTNADATLKNAQASFYGAGGGNPPSSPAYQTPEGAALAQTPTATGAARYSGTDPTSINAQAIIDGLNAPPTTRSNTPANAHLMSVLNTLSMQQTGHAYDQQAAKTAYDFRNKTATPFFAKLPTAVSTISAIADLAKQANVSNLSQLTDVVNTGRAAGWFATAAQQSAAKQLQSKLALNSDDLGLLLGAGQGSDSKIALASVIFNPNGGVQSTTDLANSVATTREHKAADYATQSGIANPTVYAHNLVQNAFSRGQQPNINYSSAGSTTTASGKAFDYAGALKAGYTDVQIKAYLSSN